MDVTSSLVQGPAPHGHTTAKARAEHGKNAGSKRTAAAQAEQLRDEQQEVAKLAKRDREVRAHELAHASVGGPHAGSPVYQYTQGPNGVRYATSGHVKVDVSVVPGDPKATLDKMQTVARAALAPVQPSAADRAIAAKANQQAAQARAELAALQVEARQQRTVNKTDTDDGAKPQVRQPFGSVSGSVIDTLI